LECAYSYPSWFVNVPTSSSLLGSSCCFIKFYFIPIHLMVRPYLLFYIFLESMSLGTIEVSFNFLMSSLSFRGVGKSNYLIYNLTFSLMAHKESNQICSNLSLFLLNIWRFQDSIIPIKQIIGILLKISSKISISMMISLIFK